MIDSQFLKEDWDNITEEGNFKQLPPIGPLKWLYGYQGITTRTLLIISHQKISSLYSSDEIIITPRFRPHDGKYTLTLALQDPENEDVFITFCSDLYNYVEQFNKEKEKVLISKLAKRYSQWNRLLKGTSRKIMEPSIIKGLIGELLFLETLLQNSNDYLSIISGWVGPEKADQDFIYIKDWYEVKAVKIDADSVKISSLEQLLPLSDGRLIIQRLDECAPQKRGSFSLNELVCRIKMLIENDIAALKLFCEKLRKVGYEDLIEYSLKRYYFEKSDHYCIDEFFPRLTTNNTPSQIVRCSYELSLPSLKLWKIK